jgi:hypothetical protein
VLREVFVFIAVASIAACAMQPMPNPPPPPSPAQLEVEEETTVEPVAMAVDLPAREISAELPEQLDLAVELDLKLRSVPKTSKSSASAPGPSACAPCGVAS